MKERNKYEKTDILNKYNFFNFDANKLIIIVIIII